MIKKDVLNPFFKFKVHVSTNNEFKEAYITSTFVLSIVNHDRTELI